MYKSNLLISILSLSLLGSTALFSKDLKTNLEKESYSLGASTGNYISNQIYKQKQDGIKTDINLVVEGFVDALRNKQKLSDKDIIASLNARMKKLNDIQSKKIKKIKKENLAKEVKFLKENKTKPGVKTTKSGLQYKIVKKGTKPSKKKVQDSSIVVIHYKAYLQNGHVFANTYKKKAPAHLSMINIISGLKEGLKLMHEGDEFKIFVPSKLGYGSVQMREIEPNSVLTFEVKLLKILKPGDLKKKPLWLKEQEQAKKQANNKKTQ